MLITFYAYNATKHDSTGFSPFEFMFGRKPKLPIDSLFQLQRDDTISTDYVEELKQKLEKLMKLLARSFQNHRKNKSITMIKKQRL